MEKRGGDQGEQELRHDVEENHRHIHGARHERGARGYHGGRADISWRESVSLWLIKC